MSWEAISALATVGTFVVITATAIAALVQLRHLHAANQINAVLGLMAGWATPEYRQLLNYVSQQLDEKLKDPAYRASLMRIPADRIAHPELAVLDGWEQLGGLAKIGAVSDGVLLETAASQCLIAWKRLAPVIAIVRRSRGPQVYDNFEYLAARALRWEALHPSGTYPRHTQHMPIVDPFPDDAKVRPDAP
jgi:hypothetical protein